jgi:hypothetical protein
MDLGEIDWGDVDWIGLAADRDKRKAPVNATMPKKKWWECLGWL